MKTRPTQIVLWSVILLTSLGLAGCCDSADQAKVPDEVESGSDEGKRVGVLSGGGASQPTGEGKAATPDDGPTPIVTRRLADPVRVKQPEPATHSLRNVRPHTSAKRQPVPRLKGSPPEVGAAPRPVMAKRHIDAKTAPEAKPMAPRPPRVFAYKSAPPDAEPAEESAPPQPEAAPMTAAGSPSTDTAPGGEAPPKDYTVVKVFYGTDRQLITSVEPHPWGKVPWGHLTAAAGGLTVLLLLMLCFARRSGLLRMAFSLSLLATVALGVCMVQIPRNTKPEEADTARRRYGNERGTLEMGVCEVSIPKDHEVGELESPSVFRFEFNEDPELHVVLLDTDRHEPEEFYDRLRRRVAQSDRKEAFVFIHGYNVTFENAARRTAQLAHDLDFDGAPIFYSWPSQGGFLQYTVDETNVVWTVPHLKEFLLGVARKTDARRVHLIAHSMGNRALTSALVGLSRELKEEPKPLFHEVLLTAPDIDADVFRRDIAPAIVQTAQRVTLYASSNDKALEASKKVHGYPRAGESGANLVVVPGIDTIDVSAVDTSLLGHTYYGDSDTVLTDMAELLRDRKPPDLRNRLRTMTLGTLRYWIFLAEKIGLRRGRPTQ